MVKKEEQEVCTICGKPDVNSGCQFENALSSAIRTGQREYADTVLENIGFHPCKYFAEVCKKILGERNRQGEKAILARKAAGFSDGSDNDVKASLTVEVEIPEQRIQIEYIQSEESLTEQDRDSRSQRIFPTDLKPLHPKPATQSRPKDISAPNPSRPVPQISYSLPADPEDREKVIDLKNFKGDESVPERKTRQIWGGLGPKNSGRTQRARNQGHRAPKRPMEEIEEVAESPGEVSTVPPIDTSAPTHLQEVPSDVVSAYIVEHFPEESMHFVGIDDKFLTALITRLMKVRYKYPLPNDQIPTEEKAKLYEELGRVYSLFSIPTIEDDANRKQKIIELRLRSNLIIRALVKYWLKLQ